MSENGDLNHRSSIESIGRREFIKGAALVGGLTLLSTVVPACLVSPRENESPAEPAVSPASVKEEGKMTKIALVRTGDRAEGVRKAISLLGSNPVRNKKVVLKPNFNSADPTPGSTHIDTLRSLVRDLQQMGAKQVTLAERSGPGDSTRTVMEKKGVFTLADELGFSILNLEEMPAESWVQYTPKESHWTNGFHFPRAYREAESIVQTCCLKTHAYGGHFTLSLKLAVGMVPRVGYPYMGQLHSSSYQRQMIAEINTAFSPDLVVLDGVEAFVDGGPARGTKVAAGVVLAGLDRVAIDAVGVAILRLLGTTPEVSKGPVFSQEQIARAAELGLGVKSPQQIQFVTGDKESETYAQKVREVLLKS
ncbi:MAG: DUF362 domain-containing protein [Dehalococcoidia bacterium]|nr:DUF362 domain-containing protein [Dehalococcoidia bacterium]